MRRLSPNIAEVSGSSTHADGDGAFANLTLGQHTIDRIGNTPLLRLARIGSEISKLVNKGYQQFLKTAKTEVPATADHLKALQQFTEELKEGLGLPTLYNESLGTVSESYHYDRVENRDKPAADRPKRPWEKAGLLAAAAKKGRA